MPRVGEQAPELALKDAATALQHGFAVFSYDRHFAEIDGLLTGQKWVDFLP